MQHQDVARGGGGISPLAEALGYAGLLPFLLALLGVGLAPDIGQRDFAQRLAIGYGAAILSFLGAVHWGLALAGRWRWSPLVAFGSILPATLATAAAMLGGQRGPQFLRGVEGRLQPGLERARAAQFGGDGFERGVHGGRVGG